MRDYDTKISVISRSSPALEASQKKTTFARLHVHKTVDTPRGLTYLPPPERDATPKRRQRNGRSYEALRVLQEHARSLKTESETAIR